eukprot:365571-Chlamydomonas_euryale.AAC.5
MASPGPVRTQDDIEEDWGENETVLLLRRSGEEERRPAVVPTAVWQAHHACARRAEPSLYRTFSVGFKQTGVAGSAEGKLAGIGPHSLESLCLGVIGSYIKLFVEQLGHESLSWLPPEHKAILLAIARLPSRCLPPCYTAAKHRPCVSQPVQDHFHGACGHLGLQCTLTAPHGFAQAAQGTGRLGAAGPFRSSADMPGSFRVGLCTQRQRDVQHCMQHAGTAGACSLRPAGGPGPGMAKVRPGMLSGKSVRRGMLGGKGVRPGVRPGMLGGKGVRPGMLVGYGSEPQGDPDAQTGMTECPSEGVHATPQSIPLVCHNPLKCCRPPSRRTSRYELMLAFPSNPSHVTTASATSPSLASAHA